MRSKSKLTVSVLIAVLLCFPSLALAESTHGEVQLIVDFIDGHEVTIFLPEQMDPNSLVLAIEEVICSKLQLQESWLDGEGGEVWLYSAPRLLPRFGSIKQARWDLTSLLAAAGETGLERLDAFLVVGLAGGLLNYDVSVSDQYGPVALSDVDGWEMWWGFGLTPDGVAPDLFTNIMLHLFWDSVNLLPLLVPVAAALLLWLVGRHLRAPALRRAGRLLTGVSLAIGLFTAYLMNWHGLLSYLGLTQAGSWSAVALIALMLMFWTQTILGLPISRFMARLAGQEWTWAAYLRKTGMRMLAFVALAAMGSIVGAAVTLLAGISAWLALAFLLVISAIFLWQLHFLMMQLFYRAQRWDDFSANALFKQLAQKMSASAPPLYLISGRRAKFANAYAVGFSRPRVYVTEALWDILDDAGRRFILAHELAHHKLRHIRPIFLGALLPLWLVVLSLASFAWTGYFWLPLLALVAAYAAYFLISLPMRMGLELAADQAALQVTGNADAAIAALLAVQEANRGLRTNPRTHPALTARMQALRAASGTSRTDNNNGGK